MKNLHKKSSYEKLLIFFFCIKDINMFILLSINEFIENNLFEFLKID